eukprot:Gregarina_sp_Poly_1__4420@NODE_2384_length_2199_cov_2205_443246_g1518_i0_p1_GENE_NODE_2384_length_2199_cov_2205_443246_g1518_i0NODE_2384_length_2199_cov_2205_443246_g1518_i0_p1_ORF_typecomplete_len525_score54_42Sugar_tr/PF00083_24/6_3e95MFS_1/PF07690_16/2_3e14MFS_1/PF07690_16/1_6e11TRI12/PF06609_13/4e08TRI12/PF06609_13/5_9MFS_3/PF05977_13/2_1e05MFS_3/PF05977_13/0_018MFS_2/PF13347_6/1_6e03MFS_2/PF13347_6/8_1e07MFS_2/PF13347_6/21MFS_4/PF06779_14/1_4_NODE_2384_length_2199_cov_2205_443246_g1518_i078
MSSLSSADGKEKAVAENEPRPLLREDAVDPDKLTVDWSKKMSWCCCSCFPYLLQLILVGCMGSFLFGINISLLNTAMNHISWEYQWCDFLSGASGVTDCTAHKNYAAFMSTAVFIGAATGSMTGGVFLTFGRRGMMLIANAVFIFGTVSSCCANSFSALLWARLLVGYAVGLVSVVVPVYMSEVTPANVRGQYGVFHQLFITIGILIGTVIGLPLPLASPLPADDEIPTEIGIFAKVWWRVMLGFAIIPILLSCYLLGAVYQFETPHYYVERGNYGDAAMLFRRILKREDVTDVVNQVVKEIEESEAAKKAGMSLAVAWKRSDYRKVIVLGCAFSAFQQFGGINVFMASSTQLFLDAGLDGYMPTVMTVIMSLINSVMTLPAVPLIEKMGRKSLLLCGCIGMTISVAPAAICYWAIPDSDATMWLSIVGCLLFVIFFAATYGPILWVYLFEIYPMEIRGAAAGLATAWNWIAGIVMVFVTNYIEANVSYTLFTVLSLVGTLLVAFFMLETKGRELGDSPYVQKH